MMNALWRVQAVSVWMGKSFHAFLNHFFIPVHPFKVADSRVLVKTPGVWIPNWAGVHNNSQLDCYPCIQAYGRSEPKTRYLIEKCPFGHKKANMQTWTWEYMGSHPHKRGPPPHHPSQMPMSVVRILSYIAMCGPFHYSELACFCLQRSSIIIARRLSAAA